jgi:hypothetical protein
MTNFDIVTNIQKQTLRLGNHVRWSFTWGSFRNVVFSVNISDNARGTFQ